MSPCLNPAFPARDELLSPIGESAARARDGVRSNIHFFLLSYGRVATRPDLQPHSLSSNR
jgi:hypothetical protein